VVGEAPPGALDHDERRHRRTVVLVDALLGLVLAVAVLVLGPGLGLIAVIGLAVIALVGASLAVGSLGRGWRARRRQARTPRL